MSRRLHPQRGPLAKRLLGVRVLTLSVVLGLPHVAAAQPKPGSPGKPGAAPTEAATADARQRFNEGVELADAGDHEAARLKFSQASSLHTSPAVLYNLARAGQLSGHLLEALEHYRLFIKMASDPKVTDVQRPRATENVAELSKKVGQIDVEAP